MPEKPYSELPLLSSPQNQRVKDYVALRDDGNVRREKKRFLLEGKRAAAAALVQNAPVSQLINHAPLAMQFRHRPARRRPPHVLFVQVIHPVLKGQHAPFRLGQIPQRLHFATAGGANQQIRRFRCRRFRMAAFMAPAPFSFNFVHIQLF